jgi:hypothetical protein
MGLRLPGTVPALPREGPFPLRIVELPIKEAAALDLALAHRAGRPNQQEGLLLGPPFELREGRLQSKGVGVKRATTVVIYNTDLDNNPANGASVLTRAFRDSDGALLGAARRHGDRPTL